jgi:tape measure domain-containing protein
MPAIIEIGLNAGGVYSGLQKVETRVDGFARRLETTLGKVSRFTTLTTAFSVPGLARFAGDLVNAAAKMEGYRAALTAVTKEVGPLENQLARLRALAKAPGLSFDEAVKGTVRLQATGFAAAESERILREFANGLRSVGGRASDLDGVTLALGQIMAKGKVSAEEINQLAERLPQVRALMRNAFGTADTEALQKMRLDSRTFVLGIVNELSKMPRVANGANSAIEQLQDNFQQLKAAAGGPLAQALVPPIKALTETMIELAPAAKDVGAAVVNLAPQAYGLARGLVAIYAGAKAIQFATFISGILAKREALVKSTAATQAETAAVQANSTAQRANAAAVAAAAASRNAIAARVVSVAGPGAAPQVGPAPYNEGATMAALAAAGERAGNRSGQRYTSAFAGYLKTAGPMLGTAATNMFATSLIPAAASAGTQAGQTASMALTSGLAMVGGRLGMVGLLGSIVNAAIMFPASRKYGQAEKNAALTDAIILAQKEADALVRGNNAAEARNRLQAELARLHDAVDSGSEDEKQTARFGIGLLEMELKGMERRVALIKAAADEEDRRIKLEAKQQEMANLNREAFPRVQALGEQIGEIQMKFATPEEKFKIISEQMKKGIEESVAKARAEMGDSMGIPEVTGKMIQFERIMSQSEMSVEGLAKAAERLKEQGDFVNAEKMLKALKEAQEQANKLKEISEEMREDAAKASKEEAEAKAKKKDEAVRIGLARQEAELQQEIVRLKIDAGGKDSEAVKAAEDKLAIMRLAAQLEQAGIAAGQAALAMAARRVHMERQLTELGEKQRLAQGRKDHAMDMAIMEAKARGQTKLVEQLERERSVRERAQQIQDQTGATPEQAMASARRYQDLQEQAEKREQRESERINNGGRRRTQGFRRGSGSVDGFTIGIKTAEELAEERRSKMGSLDGFQAPSRPSLGNFAPNAPGNANPLMAKAVANAAAGKAVAGPERLEDLVREQTKVIKEIFADT